MVSRVRWFGAALWLLASGVAGGVESSWGYRLAGAYSAPNRDGLFFLEPARRYGLQEAFVTYAKDGFVLDASAYNQAQDGALPVQKSQLNEFYLDTKVGTWDATVGKKRVEWGVGFGFRPLDVIKPGARRELISIGAEGLPQIALERYTGSDALTFLVGNDYAYHNGFKSGGTESAVRYYALINGLDTQVLVHTSEIVGYETGFALSWTGGEALELHGSALYQRHYEKTINTLTEQGGAVLASADPVEQRRFDNGIKALVGATYTWRSGHALLFEYWYDDAGYNAGEWRSLRALTQAQRALLGTGIDAAVNANILASSRFLEQPNLMQQNILLRWSYDDGEHFVPALDLLYTSQDRGLVTTLSVTQDIGTAYKLNYGARYFGGAADSVYRALPSRYGVYVDFKATFNW